MRKSKKENEVLQSTNKVLTSENEYLKKIVEINKAILETEKDNSSFKNIQNEPLFIKLFRFKANSKSKKKTDIFGINSNIEFKDLEVNWN